MPSFKLGELFCGPGGLALAALSARIIIDGKEFQGTDKTPFRFEHAWANDYDKSTCETYIRNICPESPSSVYCSPVQSLDISSLSEIDGLAFGFPCNDYSIVGEQTGMDGKFGPLYSYGVKTIDFHNPSFFLAENVGGLSNANEGNAFKKILIDLENAGQKYNIVAHLYKFEEYGVPQKRHRIIIVGFRKDLGINFKVPAPTHINNFKSAYSAFNNPPIPKDAANNEQTKHPQLTIERLKHIPPGQNAWYEKLPTHLQLDVKGARLSQIYKRLHPDEPSYTVTGSGGGGTHVYHYDEPRALTNRERARLQTFPDNYIFSGSKENVRKQIGMAVPPLGAQLIFESILKTLAGISYPSVEASWKIQDHKESDSL